MLIAKVARLDCPKEWPELFPTLLQAVENSDSIIQHRSLLTLHHVVKAISSKRLAGKIIVKLYEMFLIIQISNNLDYYQNFHLFKLAMERDSIDIYS